jgi:hypothetical protein
MPSTPVAAAFRVLQGPLKGKKIRFETSIITLGRSEDANICLPGDRSISRIHAEIELVDGHYVLQNKSNSGTFVNNNLVETRRLASGDRIHLGELYALEFTEDLGESRAARGGLRGKKLIIGGAVYLALLAGLAIFLSRSPSRNSAALSGEKIQQVMQQYTNYTSQSNLPREEQEARLRTVEAYLRSGLIAQRQGQYDEARQIYLHLLEFAQERKNPLYQYALVQLRSVPQTR